MTDNVLVLEPGDERAQKIGKAMASQTANDILNLMSEGPKSLTDITEKLDIPLTTSKYHIENLLDAGLISVADTKYSVKGREIKIYSLTNQLVIVAPRQTNIRSLLLKYASLFGIVIVGALGVSLISPLLSSSSGMMTAAPVQVNREGGGGIMAAKATYDWSSSSITPDYAFAFLIGGIFVIIILLCYEAYLWKTKRFH
jgi:DNA-binding transcriptional ArsR family regulator